MPPGFGCPHCLFLFHGAVLWGSAPFFCVLPQGNFGAGGRKVPLARMGNPFHAGKFFISRLKIHILRLKMHILSLRMHILSLRMNFLHG